MANGALPKPLQDIAGVFLVVMVAGAIALGWLNSRDWLGRKNGSSSDGLSGDDGAGHHHSGSADRAGDSGDHGGDAGGDGGH